MQGYGDHGTHFKFEGAQQTVRFGPTVGTATDSHVTFCGHQLIAKVTCVLLNHLDTSLLARSRSAHPAAVRQDGMSA